LRPHRQTDKVRIIALYILYKDGVPDEDRRRLFQHAKLSMPEQDSVNNLVHLGLKVVRNPNEREGKKRLKHKPSNSEEDYELSRYKPVVRSMLEDHIANKLDTTTFPYLRNAPELPSSSTSSRPSAVASAPAQAGSLRSQRPNWHRAAPSTAGGSGGPGGREAVKQRIILFVAGGITYSEMRSAYQVGQALGKEVVIGSTHVITPETFLKDLRSLGRSGIGANPPNAHPIHESFPLAGVKPPRTPRERYQIALDKRLWTSWVPPPAPPPMRVEPPQPLPSKKGSFGGSSSSGGASGGGSSYSKPQPVVEEKKKKRGLFKF
jgi:syntaxin-binding protein 1